MKTLTIHMTVELQVPDDWDLVEHASGITVLQVGDQFVDFDIAPLVTSENSEDATWTDENQALAEQVLECVTGLESDLELIYQQ